MKGKIVAFWGGLSRRYGHLRVFCTLRWAFISHSEAQQPFRRYDIVSGHNRIFLPVQLRPRQAVPNPVSVPETGHRARMGEMTTAPLLFVSASQLDGGKKKEGYGTPKPPVFSLSLFSPGVFTGPAPRPCIVPETWERGLTLWLHRHVSLRRRRASGL